MVTWVVSLSHKTRNSGNALGLELPIVAPSVGVSQGSWAEAWVRVNGCDVEKLEDGVPLLQTPLLNGGWSPRSLSNDKFSRWIREILIDTGCSPEPFTGHSAKRTALSWTSKFGVSNEVQALLGHHTSGVTKTPLVYARDAQAAPLRELDRVLSTIRSEAFAPDMTRSGQFASRKDVLQHHEHEWYAQRHNVTSGGNQTPQSVTARHHLSEADVDRLLQSAGLLHGVTAAVPSEVARVLHHNSASFRPLLPVPSSKKMTMVPVLQAAVATADRQNPAMQVTKLC